MNKPFISVITVCYNSDKTIRDTLESMLNQSYENYEYIIVDGKSTDKTIEILKKYEKKFNGKMRYISEKDNGIYDAMNKGIRLCKGDIIGIINSDDWYEYNALSIISSKYENQKSQVIYGMLRLVKDEKEYEVVVKNHEFIDERMITHPTCFISKNIYDKYGMYDMDYKVSADYEFMLRIRDKEDIIFKQTYDIISNFRIGGASASEVGVQETMKLKYKYKLISKREYTLKLLKSKIYSLLSNQ